MQYSISNGSRIQTITNNIDTFKLSKLNELDRILCAYISSNKDASSRKMFILNINVLRRSDLEVEKLFKEDDQFTYFLAKTLKGDGYESDRYESIAQQILKTAKKKNVWHKFDSLIVESNLNVLKQGLGDLKLSKSNKIDNILDRINVPFSKIDKDEQSGVANQIIAKIKESNSDENTVLLFMALLVRDYNLNSAVRQDIRHIITNEYKNKTSSPFINIIVEFVSNIDRDVDRVYARNFPENTYPDLDQSSRLVRMLDGYKDSTLVTILIEYLSRNYTRSGDEPFVYVINMKSAGFLLNRYADRFSKDKLADIVGNFVKNLCKSQNYEKSQYASFASKLLTDFRDKIRSEDYIAIIKDATEVLRYSEIRDLSVFSPAECQLILLSGNKDILLPGERDFYYRTLELIDARYWTTNTDSLRTHIEDMNNNTIINLFINTASMTVMDMIRQYVGQHLERNIVLPLRQDMLGGGNIAAQGMGGVAMEVHRYTDGIEPIALKTLELILKDTDQKLKSFSIENLKYKFQLLDTTKQQQAQQSLNKISNSPDYMGKLEVALPAIASLLDAEDVEWSNNYLSADERWITWLEQSFVESATAYDDGADQTSCIKGIYERLFTGFRSMHPAIDMLYLPANIKKEFANVSYKLINEKDQIVNALIKQSVKPEDANYAQKVKNVCETIIWNLFENAKNPMKKDEDFSESLPETYKYIKQYFDSKIHSLDEPIKEIMNKLLSTFESIALNPRITECIVTTMDAIPTETTFPQGIDVVIVGKILYHKKDGSSKQIGELTLSNLADDPTIQNVKQYITAQKGSKSLFIDQELSLQCNITLAEYIQQKLEQHFN